MGQEVKNPLRAQSNNGLMESSAKTGNYFFRGSPEHFLDKNAIWDRTPPHLHINCSLHVWGRVQGSQIFQWNSIISIRSKVMAFLGGLSLHLYHLIASRMANYDWPFGTLPFGLFGSNLDTRDLETYSRTYSGHF